ncbi:MAG: GNAT family N-acetyltransferase [Acidimicrobiales bacterium]
MTTVRTLETRDVDAVVERVVERLAHDASIQPLVNPLLLTEPLKRSLNEVTDQTWVAEQNDDIVGHLYGALLESEPYGIGVWIGPDGVSFDSTDILSDLYSAAGASWIERGALEHYVWTIDDITATQPWYEMGFARMHMRGVLRLDRDFDHVVPDGYVLRRGGVDDLDIAVALDDELDAVQRIGPSFSIGLDHASKRDDFLETLEDPEVHHYIVETDGHAIAQCITFPLPPRRGSFDHTLHLSAVTVDADHRCRGVGTAMVDAALRNAQAADFDFVETNWRVTNRRARNYWLGYGFGPTYVRLHRTIGLG